MRRIVRGALLATALVLGLPTAASATAQGDFYLGTVRSGSGHSGYAKAQLWVTGFNQSHFTAYGKIYDRDRHPGHCAWVRARFHYQKGGPSWSPARWSCASSGSKGYLFKTKGQVKWIDLKVCVYQPKRNALSHCRIETIRDEDLAN
ncbi:hypothetical protein ABZ260_46395 [Streptosporangium sp. NPDC006013]|uniref:hypothetical protein n=1 Tax=Streptosporangium sp. NPDC006013 TaxID=3155596 RepID=UPI0033B4340A